MKTILKKIISPRIREPLFEFLDQVKEFFRKHVPRFKRRPELYFTRFIFFFSPVRIYNRYIATKTILFYPKKPHMIMYLMRSICYFCGFKITAELNDHWDMAIAWEDITLRDEHSELDEHAKGRRVLNQRCRDIRKSYVQETFSQVFGYDLEIDPLEFNGECVAKSDINSSHDGKIVMCPIKQREDGLVYQRLVDTRDFEADHTFELRVPVFDDEIPFIYLKYRRVNDIFDNYFRIDLAETKNYLSEDECGRIIEFARKVGLDFGELDILRDKNNQKIYIIDVSNTPVSPPKRMKIFDYFKALNTSAKCFRKKFINESN